VRSALIPHPADFQSAPRLDHEDVRRQAILHGQKLHVPGLPLHSRQLSGNSGSQRLGGALLRRKFRLRRHRPPSETAMVPGKHEASMAKMRTVEFYPVASTRHARKSVGLGLRRLHPCSRVSAIIDLVPVQESDEQHFP
jgi:hypothetical protein